MEIPERDSGKTLSEVRIRKVESFVILKKNVYMPKVSLMNSTGEVAPRAKEIF